MGRECGWQVKTRGSSPTNIFHTQVQRTCSNHKQRPNPGRLYKFIEMSVFWLLLLMGKVSYISRPCHRPQRMWTSHAFLSVQDRATARSRASLNGFWLLRKINIFNSNFALFPSLKFPPVVQFCSPHLLSSQLSLLKTCPGLVLQMPTQNRRPRHRFPQKMKLYSKTELASHF